ncbi:MAG: hypothetical protein AAF368_16660, partial [Planctomycetota bacterium]
YGLTATLYHMLVCRAPYEGSPSQVISSLSQKEAPPAYRLRPGLPRDLQAILDKGMARRVSQRYSSALQLESDLRAFLNYRPVSARPVSAFGRVWRRLRRSTAFYAAASVVLLGAALAVGANLKEKQRIRHDAAFMDVFEHMPPAFGIVPNAPKISNNAERSYLRNLLDEALHWRPESVQARLLRASFRLDLGDPAGSAEDMGAIAGVLGTRYSAELAKRYRELPEAASAAADLNLEDLPELQTPLDSYVSGFHALRTGNPAQALLELSGSGLEEHAPSLELLIMVRSAMIGRKLGKTSVPSRELLQEALENYARAERLEAQVGQRTAVTAHLIGMNLINLKKYREAIDPLEDGMELCPWSFGLHNNDGIVTSSDIGIINFAGNDRALGFDLEL